MPHFLISNMEINNCNPGILILIEIYKAMIKGKYI